MGLSRRSVQAALVHAEMIELERSVVEVPVYVRPLFGGADPTLRDALFRAGAVWLIAWATCLAAVQWMPRVGG
jgi:hypothetical protein